MKILIFLFIVFNISIIHASESVKKDKDAWVVITIKDGFTIYSKESKNSPIRSMRAKGVVNAPVDKIVAILRDVNSAIKWVPNLIERSYVENISDVEAILYDVTDMPWPVDDRDLVVHHKLTLSPDKKQLILYFKSVPKKHNENVEDRVRAKIHFGKIYFTPNEDKTEVELVMLVDPMGSIPKWAVNVLQVSMPYDFLMSLNEFAVNTKLTPLPGIQKLLDQIQK